jgi:Flp pilus assembly protein TadD
VAAGHLYARRVPREPRGEAPLLALAAAVLWVGLLSSAAPFLPVEIGFDVTGHLEYIAHLQERGSLPLGGEGWQMYQPPLYYLLAAGLLSLLSLPAASPEATLALRGLGAALGAAQLVLLYASARLLLPGRRLVPALALVFAAALPLHTTLFQCVGNEALAMPLVSAVAAAGLRALRPGAPPPGATGAALLGALAGLAALAKFSAVLVLPPLLLALAARGRARPALAARGCAALLAAFVAVCGWHFARVWLAYGGPLVGNWDPALGFDWWQDPGARTAGDYLRFGSALTRPWFAGLAGVPDGLYSTLFGDGLLSGRREPEFAPPWDLELMAAGYALALVPAALALVGATRAAARLLARPSADWLLALALGVVAAAALLAMTLRVPAYTLVKAHFGHPGLVALTACLALGLERALRAPLALRAALLVAFGTWALASLAAVRVDPASASTLSVRGHHWLHARALAPAREAFAAALASEPAHAGALAGLVAVELLEGRGERAEALCEEALRAHPGSAPLLERCARAHARGGQGERAEAELRRSLALRPADREARALLAALLARSGRLPELAALLRDGLASRPADPELHLELARLELAAGRAAAAQRHLGLVLALEPRRREALALREAIAADAAAASAGSRSPDVRSR